MTESEYRERRAELVRVSVPNVGDWRLLPVGFGAEAKA